MQLNYSPEGFYTDELLCCWRAQKTNWRAQLVILEDPDFTSPYVLGEYSVVEMPNDKVAVTFTERILQPLSSYDANVKKRDAARKSLVWKQAKLIENALGDELPAIHPSSNKKGTILALKNMQGLLLDNMFDPYELPDIRLACVGSEPQILSALDDIASQWAEEGWLYGLDKDTQRFYIKRGHQHCGEIELQPIPNGRMQLVLQSVEPALSEDWPGRWQEALPAITEILLRLSAIGIISLNSFIELRNSIPHVLNSSRATDVDAATSSEASKFVESSNLSNSRTALLKQIEQDERLNEVQRSIAMLWLSNDAPYRKEIASRCMCADKTVSNHLTKIYKLYPEARRRITRRTSGT